MSTEEQQDVVEGPAGAPEPGVEHWDAIADAFDRFTTTINFALGETALARIDLGPGDRFLDVAAGSGGLALPAARTGAEVMAVDYSPAMIERLEARARSEGLENLEGRVMDGQDLALEDDAFDAAASQFGVMLFPDLPRGLREMVRVTRPGGAVMMVVFGPPAESEFFGFTLGALRAAVPEFPGLPTDPPPLPFQVSDPVKLRDEMRAAGARDVRVETINHRVPFESGRHLWNVFTNSNPIGEHLVADLPEEGKTAAIEILERMIRQRSGGGGPAVLENMIHVAVGEA
ncbi:MAG: class I SAM-dependent methyltransferase [Gemmatimonadota bacterium]